MIEIEDMIDYLIDGTPDDKAKITALLSQQRKENNGQIEERKKKKEKMNEQMKQIQNYIFNT